MHALLRKAFEEEMAIAASLCRSGKLDDAFLHLERAHVLGQGFVLPHVRAHWAMLKIGLMRRSPAEVVGQAIRIVLGAIGSAVNVVPTGNTGGTNISMFKRLPIPQDMSKIIHRK